MTSPRCEHCGRPTTVVPIRERSVTDNANTQVRQCRDHGTSWQKQPDDEPR